MSGLPSWLLRETERNDRHVHCSIFVGPDADHRALAGRLVLDHDQYADLTSIFTGDRRRRRVDVDSLPVDGPVRYASLAAFYEARVDRERSGEVDFGVMWRDEEPWPNYRLSWIIQTGELYALCLRGGPGAVEVLGTVRSRERVEEILAGWAELDESRLDWVRERIRAA